MKRDYQMCSRCVMDTSDPDIVFNDEGVCNHCLTAEKNLPKYKFTPQQEGENLKQIREKVLSRKRRKYDCIVGLSGGVDSSFLAYLAVKKMGLKPLAIHLDNGWNSEIAVANINNIVERLNLDLDTYVIDWEEFRSLQRSFIQASVVDVELLSDHAIHAVAHIMSKRHKVRTVLSGGNYVTEHGLPDKWYWSLKQDALNIKSIDKEFSNTKLKTFPFLDTIRTRIMQKTGYGLYSIQVLNNINYNKPYALEVLKNELGWKDYGGKHRESTWTRFYQDYYLPKKFNIDKRRVHLSALIRTKSVERGQALNELNLPAIPENEESEFVEYVIKKLGFEHQEFLDMLKNPRIEHDHYPTELKRLKSWSTAYQFIKRRSNSEETQ